MTLVSPKDLDASATAAVTRWTGAIAVADLHANQVGLQRLEEIAWPIHAFLAEHDCRFVITRLEKRHLASTKFVDTIIDSGINPAVPPHVYGNRLLRLGLAHAITSNISPRSQEEWWTAFQTGNIDLFRQIVRRVHINVTQPWRVLGADWTDVHLRAVPKHDVALQLARIAGEIRHGGSGWRLYGGHWLLRR